MKIIGRATVLEPERIAALVFQHLKITDPLSGWQGILQFSERPKGSWISYTFWITLPDEHTERPLREAIQRLPGVVMQL